MYVGEVLVDSSSRLGEGKREELEELQEVFKVPQGWYSVIGQYGNFRVLYLKEPKILFGQGYKSTLFPRDFRLARKFYTSSIPINVTLKFLYTGRDRLLPQFLQSLKLWSERFNFHVSLEPQLVQSYSELCEEILKALQGAGTRDSKDLTVGGMLGPATRSECNNIFERTKAYSLIYRVPTHLINANKFNNIINECVKGENARNVNDPRELEKCKAYESYLLNNVVQLYAKAGGIPWVPEEGMLLKGVVVIGLSTAKMKSGAGNSYIVGTAFSIAYLGREIRSYAVASLYSDGELDWDFRRSSGIYIPRRTIRELLSKIREVHGQPSGFIIFQTPVIHPEEIEGVRDVLGYRNWILVHVKRSGFLKRIYDKSTVDWGPYRGICAVNDDYIDTFKDNGVLKAILVSTGRARIGNREEALYRATPKPLELEIRVDVRDAEYYKDPQALASYISRIVLLLGKLDWEAFTNWPKVPFVIKYAHRLAKIIATVDTTTKGKILGASNISPVSLRFIM
jgi:hypothetical protein